MFIDVIIAHNPTVILLVIKSKHDLPPENAYVNEARFPSEGQ